MDGTWSAWPSHWWVSCDGRFPTKYLSPDVPDGVHSGLDAEGRYAGPGSLTTGASCEDDRRRDGDLQFSLDAGASFFDPTPTAGDGAFNTQHVYEYIVTGTGQQAAFSIQDTRGDNHGVMKITIEILDSSAPVITANVTGTMGDNGWHTSDVSVSWTVTDPESDVTSTTGFEAANVASDTDGVTFTCEATSAGGTDSESVTIKRDATDPTVTYSGNAGSYDAAASVEITCVTSDNLSGVASDSCADLS
ncbi:MAG: hypothetical protein WD079_03165, partial [Phycisphaeraceae bacterium]